MANSNRSVWSCLQNSACLLLIPSLAGCGSGDGLPRVAAEGNVTRNGQPLKSGSIRFTPAAGAKGPAAGGEIRDGRYVIDSDRGPVAGKYQVTITPSPEGKAMPVPGKTPPTPPADPSETFDAEIKPDQTHEQDFALQGR